MKRITHFLTLLLMLLSVHAFAQSEDFESTAVGDIPNGWTKYQSANDDPGFTVQDQTGYAYEGSKFLAHEGVDLNSESTSWVVSNSIHLTTAYELKFAWRGKWASAYNYSGVYISTGSSDPVANPGDFVELKEFSPANFPNTWLQWNIASFDLSAYDNHDVYIAFKYVGDHAHDFFVDNFEVGAMPVCETPQNFEVTNKGITFIDVAWHTIPDVNEYEVVWGAPGFDPATATNSMIVSTNSAHITGLTQETDYDIYVRAHCTSYNYSSWEGPLQEKTLGPPPANDDCANAVNLDIYDFGTSAGHETDGNTTYATDSQMHPSCDDTGDNLDVWYTFTVPTGVDTILVLTGGNEGAHIEAALYDSCGGSEIDCQGAGSSKIFTGLTGGQTYTLQVWHDSYYAGTFTIAIEKNPPVPANDDCVNATNLTVYDYGATAGNETSGDTTYANDSQAHPSCDDFGTNLDVWYTFTVPAGEDKVIVLTGGDKGDKIEAALYDNCGGTELDCKDRGDFKIFTGLTGGQTYTLQVWHDQDVAGAFDIAIEKAPPVPANDDCANTMDLTVYDYGASAGYETEGNTLSATDSNVHPSCDDSGTNLDVWYTFTVPTGANSINVLTGGADGNNIKAAVYDSCGGTEIDCQDAGSSKIFSGLTAGQTYILQVWHDEENMGFYTIALEKGPGCGDTFYDDGGPNGDYSSNLNYTVTFLPDNPGDIVTVTFNSFDMEKGYDGVMIYDGVDTSGALFDSGSTYNRPTCPNGAWTGTPSDTYTANGKSFTATNPDGALTLVFTSDGSIQHDGWEASITCAPPPTCASVSDLAVSNITTSQADLSWVENGSATTWNIEYGVTGFAQGSGTVISGVTANPYTLTGLDAGTTYDFYVQADCGGGDTSTWAGPNTFNTDCLPKISSFPYIQNFDNNGNIPNCWTNDPNDAGGEWKFTGANSHGPTSDHTGSGYYALLDDYFTDTPDSPFNLLTPIFDLSGGAAYQLKYWYWIGPNGDDHPIHVDISTDAGVTWNEDVFVHDHSVTGTWTENVIDLSSFNTANVVIRFRGVSIYGYNTDNSGIDDMMIDSGTSIADTTIDGFKFYPNPVKQTLNLSAKDTIEMIRISNVMGQEVLSLRPNTTQTQVDMSRLNNGVYFVKVQINGQLTAFKIVKR